MKYAVILADVPWRWSAWSPRGEGKSASRHYPVMSLDAIKAMPVELMADKDCILFFWAINSMLPQALDVIDAWGFTYKTVAFTWAKRTPTDRAWHMGAGYWTRQNTEHCLLATRGKPKRLGRGVRELLIAPRRQHSRKPDEQYERIEALAAGPYLELFARTARSGWDTAYSDEAGKFAA